MITIFQGKKEIKFKQFIFPGGEIGVKLDFLTKESLQSDKKIIAKLTSSDEVIKLAMVKNALEQISDSKIDLFLTYLPYGRQDRVCDKGESFSLKVIGNYINSLHFDSVTIFDPHSSVSEVVLNKVKVITQFDIINKFSDIRNRVGTGCILVSPDAGANKKTSDLARYFNHIEFVRADKLRDLATGNIKETIVYCENFKGKDVICFDDILDGGRTFLELAKVCKSKNCNKFVLYSTHCIASKGFDILFDNGVDEIYTTNSFRDDFDSRVKVFDIQKFLD